MKFLICSECKKNGVITQTSTVNGFSTVKDYNVHEVDIDDNGNYSVNVSWQTPLGTY